MLYLQGTIIIVEYATFILHDVELIGLYIKDSIRVEDIPNNRWFNVYS
jgi:hypothetical protein